MRLLLELLAILTPYGTFSYFVMFGILLACGFGLPMPEDIVLISGGILAARGITEFWIVLAVCMAGVLIGDGIIFYLGRRFGPAIKSKGIFKKVINPRIEQRVTDTVDKYGDKVIFMARFMPGLRTPIFMTCGIYQVKPWKFLLLDGLAALVSVPLWVWVGFWFGKNLEDLEVRIRQFQTGIYVTLALGIIGLIAFNVTRRRKENAALR